MYECMKNLLFLLVILLVISCSSDNNRDDDFKDNPVALLRLSDEIVGIGQVVILSCEYETDNPNILLTWFENGEKLNSTPKSDLDFYWSSTEEGEKNIKVSITDGDKIIETSIDVEVVACDLGSGILGDNKEKIKRTLGLSDDESARDVITYQWNGYSYLYYFDKNLLDKIEKIQYVNKIPQNKIDYTYPVMTFKSIYDKLKNKYGDPVNDTYDDLEQTEEAIIRYGGYIYSGSMQISADFENETTKYSVVVNPSTKYYSGYDLRESIELK
nr:MAG TPA: protein of unknown function (DUF5016) [Caudoviricetes sp.]